MSALPQKVKRAAGRVAGAAGRIVTVAAVAAGRLVARHASSGRFFSGKAKTYRDYPAVKVIDARTLKMIDSAAQNSEKGIWSEPADLEKYAKYAE